MLRMGKVMPIKWYLFICAITVRLTTMTTAPSTIYPEPQ